ncbi:alpha carbonic anhydrase 7-like [Punica granatum]|uniref:Carbonic anhydrase n=1 Tax=Punica granatum TaxID=22663 RepID=A0A6P8DP96_PUNGR|nr:alpha carbonic anhydrase 7-like [Punica granatum]
MKSRARAELSSPSFLILILLALFSYTLPGISAQEVEDEREFDYEVGGEKGPSHWGELKEEWEACKSGRMQSPIDMSSQRVKVILKSSLLKKNHFPGNATIKNRGHDISVQWELGKAGSIRINGTRYFLQQCHWHSPSEHSINGRRYDMEMHMVHVSPNPTVKNKIVVLGLLYQSGAPNPFISKLMGHVRSMIDKHEERTMGVINPEDIKMGGKKYYKYMGSLTVPPCTEGVIWIINKKLMTVSRDQVALLREAVHDYAENNARPLQPLNKREIHLHVPTE